MQYPGAIANDLQPEPDRPKDHKRFYPEGPIIGINKVDVSKVIEIKPF